MLSAHAFFRSASSSSKRYEPFAQIGRGGMAEVLLSMMDAGGGTRRLAVLKRIGPELATDPDFVEMFLDEARLSLRLSHANVVQAYELLVGDNELAIAMEYLDGQPLTRVLNRLLRGRGELSLPLRLRILTKILAGLEHAHTLTDLDGSPLGVVHRDVSPQNVFVTYDGQVKLVDFGVAKTLVASHQTRPGAIKGKLVYMAPEQLQAESVDRRADLFSVGVMLWEMLALRRMWHKRTEVEIVGHLSSGRPMPALPVRAGDLPTGLDAICMRALEMDPARRYQTAAEMELDLEEVLVGVADSHARNLGNMVSLGFAAERAERQAVIERCLRRNAERAHDTSAPTVAPASFMSDPLPTIEVPVEGLEDRTPPGDAPPASAAPLADISPSFTDAPGPLADIVTPLAGIAVPLADLAPPVRAGGVTTLADVAVAAHEKPTVTFRAPTPALPFPTAPPSLAAASRAVRRWRAAAVAGLAAFAVTVLVGVTWRRGAENRPAPSTAAVAARPAAPPSQAAPAPTAASAPVRARGPRSAATRAAAEGAANDDADRPRRHRREKLPLDEDATLPPTGSSEGDL